MVLIPSVLRGRTNGSLVWLAIAALLTTLGQGCSISTQASDAQTRTLVLTGSSTVAPLVADIGKQFEKDYPSTRIDVQTGGSSRGIADARSGVANIGLVSRDLKGQEKDLVGHPIARDGISVILHRDNPINDLSNQQIRQIFTKKITNWQQVGGKDRPITVINKAQGRSTLELFEAYFEFQPRDIQADVIIGDNQQGLKTVAANPDSIGYVSIGAAQIDMEQGSPIKLLPINGVPATLTNVQNKTFPLSRSLNLVTKGVPEDLAKTFIDYATSNQVHDVVQRQFFVPIQK